MGFYCSRVNHESIDQRSLALEQAVVSRLREDPSLIAKAKENLTRWLKQNNESPSLCRCYLEWIDILENRSQEDIECLMLSTDEESTRLRQNSPFVGILTPREVWEIKKQYRNETSRP